MTGPAGLAPRCWGLLGVLAGASVLAGCAVLTVDVDVYKGPLANDHDVQIEQMAVMAVGAERLLSQLDRNLTQEFLIKSGGRWVDKKLDKKDQRKKATYPKYPKTKFSPHSEIFRYVGNAQPYCTGKHENTEAEIIPHPQVAHFTAARELIGRPMNEGIEADLYRWVALIRDIKAVRCLYYDLPDKKKSTTTEASLRLDSILEGLDTEAKKLTDALKIYLSESPSPLQQKLARSLTNPDIPGSFRRLARAYREFLAPPVGERKAPRKWGYIFWTLFNDFNLQKVLGIRGADTLNPMPWNNPLGTTAVLGFEELRNRRMLKTHAEYLFPEDAGTQNRFVAEIVRIADSYFTVREASSRLLILSLEGLSAPDFEAVIGVERNTGFIRSLVNTVVDIIDMEGLGVLLTVKDNFEVVKLKEVLIKYLANSRPFNPDGSANVQVWTNANRGPIKRALKNLLFRNSIEWAETLLRLDDTFRQPNLSIPYEIVDGKEIKDETIALAYSDPARRRFGLALGPGEDRPGPRLKVGYDPDSMKERSEDTIRTFNEQVSEEAFKASLTAAGATMAIEARSAALRSSTTTLGRGRLKLGLFTRIERYLKRKNQDVFKSQVNCFKQGECELGTVKEEREALSLALIRFAEKVLPLANNIGLFSEIGSRRGSAATNISAYGESDLFEPSRTGGNNADDKESRATYVRVLQTVGNSIQVFADAIKKKEKHDKKLVKSAEAEARAILRVFDGGPSEIYDRFLASIKADHESFKAANKEVADAKKVVAAAAKALDAEVKKFNASAPSRGEIDKLELAWKALGKNPFELDSKAGLPEPPDLQLKKNIEALPLPSHGTKGLYEDIKQKVSKAYYNTDPQSESGKSLKQRREITANLLWNPVFQKAVLKTNPATKDQLHKRIESEIQFRHQKANGAFKAAMANFKDRKSPYAAKAKGVNKAEKNLNSKKMALKQAQDTRNNLSPLLNDAFDILKRADVRKAVLHQVDIKAYREPLGPAVHRETIEILKAMKGNKCVLPAKYIIAAGTDGHEPQDPPVPQAVPIIQVPEGSPLENIDRGGGEVTETLSISGESSAADLGAKQLSSVQTTMDKCKNALAVLEGWPPPSEPSSALVKSFWLGNKKSPKGCVLEQDDENANGCKEERKTAKDIFDEMIAILRHKHLRAVEDSGPGSGPVGRAAAALVEAYRQRANMIYIRPALAYLRTSFTASTLLDNNKAWKNLLENHGYRSGLPYFPERFDEIKKKIEAEIDTQFWQNINRVQVSGVGDSNYVITKDDIGNWYVKSFSTDVSDIAKAATNLALFSAGGAISAPGSLREGPDGQPVRRETTLERQLRRFKEKHIQELRGILGKANAGAKLFSTRILENAEKRMTGDTARLEALKEIVTPSDNDKLTKQVLELDAEEIEDKDVPDKVTDVLVAIRSYHSNVVGYISTSEELIAKKAGTAMEKTDRRSAATAAATQVIIGDELKQLVKDAQDSLQNYVTAILFIGDSVRSEIGQEPLPGETPKLPAPYSPTN
ncbi:MAG: hypothetical protein IH994_06225 [Proteobacteria bacterium]|nr:hypothetical protein [Pseudomonadota bacterium]